jgi:hypothetical protein
MTTFYVAGMHRSGTSAATRVLNLLGLSLGPEEHLIAPTPNNPLGFWEQTAVWRLNDLVLAHLGGTWDEPPPTPDGWVGDPDLRALVDRARAVLAELRASSARPLVVKDPRFCLTLPLWQASVAPDRVVLPVRDPGAVAQSLGRRNAIEPSRALGLWLRYHRELLLHAPSPVVVDYPTLLGAPLAAAEHLGEALSVGPPPEPARREILAFVDGTMDHAGSDPAGSSLPLLDAAREVYELLRSGNVAEARTALLRPPR